MLEKIQTGFKRLLDGHWLPGRAQLEGSGSGSVDVVLENPQLILIDTGITVRLSPKDLKNFRSLFRYVLKNKGEKVGELMLTQAPQQWCKDPEAFKKDMAQLVKKARSQAVDLRSTDVSKLLSEVFTVVSKHGVVLESNFTSVVLAVMVLEGLGRSLDPTLDLLECARPFVFKL